MTIRKRGAPVMAQPSHRAASGSAIITRVAVIGQLEARLSGTIDDAALAAWAFDRFYAAELGDEQLEPGAAASITDALDALMFGDDPSFRLDQEELRGLIAQLGTV